MPTRNINLTPKMDRFVDAKIRSGQYANASEVLRAGLRALDQDEREENAEPGRSAEDFRDQRRQNGERQRRAPSSDR